MRKDKEVLIDLVMLLIVIFSFTFTVKGQYPFEKFPAIKYKVYNELEKIDTIGKNIRVQNTLTIPNFFDKRDNLTLNLISFTRNWENDSSIILIYRNNDLIQKIYDTIGLNLLDSLRVADINGDGLLDIKLITNYGGCGLGSLYSRIIYLFQQKESNFKYISFDDMLETNRVERDMNSDGNYEIINMKYIFYKSHSYWLFNLYNYNNGTLVNVNKKYNYPIMIQYLNRNNYTITNKISKAEMKKFELKLPDNYIEK